MAVPRQRARRPHAHHRRGGKTIKIRLYPRGPDGTLYADIRVGSRRDRRSTGTSARREALRIAQERARELIASTPAHYDEPTLYDTLRDWLKAEPRGRSDCSAVRTILARYPDRPVNEISDTTLREALGAIAPATYNRHLAVIRAAMNLAAAGGAFRPPRLKKRPVISARLRFLSADEWQRLRAELPEHLRDMAEFTLATGLRQANVLCLEWSQIDLPRRVAWIHADQAKGRRVISIPLNDDAVAVLRRQIGRHTSRVFTYRGRAMATIHGGTVARADGSRKGNSAWSRALARAGIRNLRWHDLRHTWASWHVMAGTPLAVLRELGGWQSIEMVQRYAHLAPDHIAGYAGNARPPAAEKRHNKGTRTA